MYEYKAKVTGVHDGDTFNATIDLGFTVGVDQTFRMQGINAPELKGLTMMAGTASRDRLRELIMDKQILVRSFKPDTSMKQEKYGRYLAKVFVSEDGGKTFTLDVNKVMVSEGLAVVYMANV
jgi:micrococcal nuclease